jgi:hypothetical protein
MVGLLELPVGVVDFVLEHLESRELIKLRTVSKDVKNIVEWSERIGFRLSVDLNGGVYPYTKMYFDPPNPRRIMTINEYIGCHENGLWYALSWVREVYFRVPDELESHDYDDFLKVLDCILGVFEGLCTLRLSKMLLFPCLVADCPGINDVMKRLDQSRLDFEAIVNFEAMGNDMDKVMLSEKLTVVGFKGLSGQHLWPLTHFDYSKSRIKDLSFNFRTSSVDLSGFKQGLNSDSLRLIRLEGAKVLFPLTEAPNTVEKLIISSGEIAPHSRGICPIRSLVIARSSVGFFDQVSFPNLQSLTLSDFKTNLMKSTLFLKPLLTSLEELHFSVKDWDPLDILFTNEFQTSTLTTLSIDTREPNMTYLRSLQGLKHIKYLTLEFSSPITEPDRKEIKSQMDVLINSWSAQHCKIYFQRQGSQEPLDVKTHRIYPLQDLDPYLSHT